MTDQRECAKCHTAFPATPEFFHRNVRSKGGLATWCKPCLNAATVDSRRKRRARGRDDGPQPSTIECRSCGDELPFTTKYFMRDFHQPFGLYKRCRKCTNQERADHRRRQVRTRQEASDDWRRTKQRVKHRVNKDPTKERARRMLRGIVERSRWRGFDRDRRVTRQLLESRMRDVDRCPCCDVVLDHTIHFEGGSRPNAPSVDRLDPSEGYTVENIRILCWRCNELKRDATLAELQNLVNWLLSELS